MRNFARPARGVPILLALLVAGATLPAAAEGDPIVVTTATGHRLVGEAAPAAPGFLGLRIGAATYELERSGTRIDGEAAAGSDPAWQALVDDLVRRLDHPDPALADAARAGLMALGPDALPYLEREAQGGPEARREAVASVVDALRRRSVPAGAR